jgi:hypothetical protein
LACTTLARGADVRLRRANARTVGVDRTGWTTSEPLHRAVASAACDCLRRSDRSNATTAPRDARQRNRFVTASARSGEGPSIASRCCYARPVHRLAHCPRARVGLVQAGARAAAARRDANAATQTSVTDAPLYVVKPGDTLETVARSHRVTVCPSHCHRLLSLGSSALTHRFRCLTHSLSHPRLAKRVVAWTLCHTLTRTILNVCVCVCVCVSVCCVQVQELISANSASYIMAYSRGEVLNEGTVLILRRPVGPNAAAALKALQERRAAERAPRSKAEMRAEAARKEAAAREAKAAEAKAAKEAKEAAAAQAKAAKEAAAAEVKAVREAKQAAAAEVKAAKQAAAAEVEAAKQAAAAEAKAAKDAAAAEVKAVKEAAAASAKAVDPKAAQAYAVKEAKALAAAEVKAAKEAAAAEARAAKEARAAEAKAAKERAAAEAKAAKEEAAAAEAKAATEAAAAKKAARVASTAERTQSARASTSTAAVGPAASSPSHSNHKYEPQFSRNVDINVMKMMHSRPGGVGVYLKKDLLLMVRGPASARRGLPHSPAYRADAQPARTLASHATHSPRWTRPPQRRVTGTCAWRCREGTD